MEDLYHVNEYCFDIISENETEVLVCFGSSEQQPIYKLYAIGDSKTSEIISL